MGYKVDFGKVYATAVEHEFRFKIFAENLMKIERHNMRYDEGKETYFTGINKFTDMLHSEFVETMLMDVEEHEGPADVKPLPQVEVPDSFDWRPKGAVTPIKDQGACGSCWAFSAIASTEGAHFIQTGKLVSLSEQNVMDCQTACYSCGGGWEYKGLQYIAQNGGVDTEESYPYTARDGSCHFDPNNVGAVTTGVKYTVPYDEDDLKNAVATIGPISVGIDASPFGSYSGGILKTMACSTSANHAVTVVGYGTENGQDYWLVKNSWGKSWGEEGYVRMARNYNNMCGIAKKPCYPSV